MTCRDYSQQTLEDDIAVISARERHPYGGTGAGLVSNLRKSRDQLRDRTASLQRKQKRHPHFSHNATSTFAERDSHQHCEDSTSADAPNLPSDVGKKESEDKMVDTADLERKEKRKKFVIIENPKDCKHSINEGCTDCVDSELIERRRREKLEKRAKRHQPFERPGPQTAHYATYAKRVEPQLCGHGVNDTCSECYQGDRTLSLETSTAAGGDLLPLPIHHGASMATIMPLYNEDHGYVEVQAPIVTDLRHTEMTDHHVRSKAGNAQRTYTLEHCSMQLQCAEGDRRAAVQDKVQPPIATTERAEIRAPPPKVKSKYSPQVTFFTRLRRFALVAVGTMAFIAALVYIGTSGKATDSKSWWKFSLKSPDTEPDIFRRMVKKASAMLRQFHLPRLPSLGGILQSTRHVEQFVNDGRGRSFICDRWPGDKWLQICQKKNTNTVSWFAKWFGVRTTEL